MKTGYKGNLCTLRQLKAANIDRQKYFPNNCEVWDNTKWALAMTGEVGELLNKIKKLNRGDVVELDDLRGEAADIIIYLEILCRKLGFDLRPAIEYKFNKDSDELGVHIKIDNY